MIVENGFYIIFLGDESVGFYNKEYVLNGYFTFESLIEFKEFKELLKVLFKHIDDDPLVESFSERNAFLKDENALQSNIRNIERFYNED